MILASDLKNLPPYPMMTSGVSMEFNKDLGDALIEGWHPAEHDHVWSKDNVAKLKFFVDRRIVAPFQIQLTVECIIHQHVYITSSRHVVGILELSNYLSSHNIWILPEFIGNDSALSLNILTPQLFSPRVLSRNDDSRKLGTLLKSISVTPGYESWGRRSPPLLSIARPIDIHSGLQNALLIGWHQDEGGGAWMTQGQAILCLSLDEAANRGCRMVIRVIGSPRSAASQALTVSTPHRIVGRAELTCDAAEAAIDFHLAPSDVGVGGDINLIFDLAAPAVHLGDATPLGDGFGVGISSVALRL